MKFTWTNRRFKHISLKKFLKRYGISHRMFSSIKRSGGLFLNHQAINASLPLKLGDRVTVRLPPEESNPQVLVSSRPLRIVYEDDNWLVLNKPAGLTSVPGPSNQRDTVVNRVKGHLIAEGAQNLRPHLVTRLDRFTSGLLLIAKHLLANNLANRILARREIKKGYVALVAGSMKNRHGQIKLPVGRLPGEVRRRVMANGSRAWTEYWVIKAWRRFTLVRVALHTGRTHQIRVHFSEVGHPLLGDKLYGGPQEFGIRHQALQANRLAFWDPFTKRRLIFRLPLPIGMKDVIQEANHEKS